MYINLKIIIKVYLESGSHQPAFFLSCIILCYVLQNILLIMFFKQNFLNKINMNRRFG